MRRLFFSDFVIQFSFFLIPAQEVRRAVQSFKHFQREQHISLIDHVLFFSPGKKKRIARFRRRESSIQVIDYMEELLLLCLYIIQKKSSGKRKRLAINHPESFLH